MVTPDNRMSLGGQHALQDMVELKMYLLAESQQTPWPILPRRPKKLCGTREPHGNVIESSVAKELVGWGLIEATSNRTFVVSKSGYQFYERILNQRDENV